MSDETTAAPEQNLIRVCGIPREELLNFGNDLSLLPKSPARDSLINRWKSFRTIWNRYDHTMERERLERARDPKLISLGGSDTRLAKVFSEIDQQDIPADEKYTLRLRAFKESFDLVELQASLMARAKEGSTDAQKLIVQIIGLLNEQERAQAPPVFNFNVIVRDPERPMLTDVKAIEA